MTYNVFGGTLNLAQLNPGRSAAADASAHYSCCVSVYTGEALEEDVVWPLLLPRPRAGTSQVRSSRLEHSVRVQRERPPHQHAPDAGDDVTQLRFGLIRS